MFDLTFLGTSASAPSIHRGLSAQLVSYRDMRFLVDCGEGTQRQILRSGTGFRRLNHILITHGHLDHMLGLAGLLSTFSRWEAMEKINIWAGRWALERISDLLYGVVLRGAKSAMNIELHEVEAGILMESGRLRLTAFPVEHRGPDCFGYLFEETPRRPFLPEKAAALNLPAGPVRKLISNGETVSLPDGRVITPDDVLGPPVPGTRLAITGDCAKPKRLLRYVKGVDALVTEATYCENEKELARKFGHMTVQQAAELAREADVGHLYLTHFSRRYRERDLQEEAAQYFPRITIARDFDHFQIKRHERDRG